MEKNEASKKIFVCKICKYWTKFAKDHQKHLITKKHLKNAYKMNNNIDIETNEIQCNDTIRNIDELNLFCCEFCNMSYKSKSGLYRHYTTTCIVSKNQELQESIKNMEHNRVLANRYNSNTDKTKSKLKYLFQKYHEDTMNIIKLLDKQIKINQNM